MLSRYVSEVFSLLSAVLLALLLIVSAWVVAVREGVVIECVPCLDTSRGDLACDAPVVIASKCGFSKILSLIGFVPIAALTPEGPGY